MEKIIELLTFKLADLTFGIDCVEIIQMITNKMIIAGFMDYDNEEYKFYKAGDLLNIKEDIQYGSLLLIEGAGKKNFAFYITSSMDIIKTATEDIKIMPEYIRNKQNPLFNWGFVENEEGLVILLTFNYFNKR